VHLDERVEVARQPTMGPPKGKGKKAASGGRTPAAAKSSGKKAAGKGAAGKKGARPRRSAPETSLRNDVS
jgi:hypothetical protein